MEKKYTTGQAAKLLKVSQTRVGVFVREGRLKAERDPIFGYWLIAETDLKKFKRTARKDGRPKKIS